MSPLVVLDKGKRPRMWCRDCLPVIPAIDLPARKAPQHIELPNVECGLRTALPIRQRSRHISIAEPEPQIPPNAGDNHIVGESTLGKQWISALSRFSHSLIVAIRLKGADGT